MTDATIPEDGGSTIEQDVTPLELFFDLVFVFAFTQVTGFLITHLTWVGMLRGVEGFHVTVSHFVERHRLVVIIALGESLVAIGVGASGISLTPTIVLGALLGIILVSALWWLYFEYVVLAAEQRLASARGRERSALARDSYSYIHLLIVGSIIYIVLGIEQTLAHIGTPLPAVAAVALYSGGALYLIGHNAFRYLDHGTVDRRRLFVTALTIVLLPVALHIPSIVALTMLTVLFIGLVVAETVHSPVRPKHRSQ
ncbi:low temperature requirement protein A [Halocatena halophila]|uniref:low temperature requirement protein A n=1 Tax=Halocatena halophila TaxID=2814576 RepID=UPI002ED6603C